MTVDHTEVIVVGGGWVGWIMAAELATAGRRVTIVERGDWPGEAPGGYVEDHQGRYPSRDVTQDVSRETFTLRHSERDVALPIRRLNSFWVAEAVGGSGLLWGGLSPRFVPDAFRAKSAHAERSGSDRFPENSRLIDWPISYGDLEPDYAAFESIVGVSGSGDGNPFAGPRSAPFPVTADALGGGRVVAALREAGMNPYPWPIADIGVEYTNSYGVVRELDEQTGRSIATPLNTVVPYALGTGLVTVVTGARVTRILSEGKRVTGVAYQQGNEHHELTGASVVLAAWALNNVRLLLLSRIGRPYDPITERGTVGRNHANHVVKTVNGFVARDRPDAGEWATGGGWAFSDFDPWPRGAAAPGHVGGVQVYANDITPHALYARPTVPEGSPRWGHGLRRALDEYRDSGVKLTMIGEVLPNRYRHLDLDPRYRDADGDPLLRISFDWTDNERTMVRDVSARLAGMLNASGLDPVDRDGSLPEHYDITPYQNSHATGGAVMGNDPETSFVDSDLRSWEYENLWVVGTSAFPTSAAPNPTMTLGALALRASRSVARHTDSSPPKITP